MDKLLPELIGEDNTNALNLSIDDGTSALPMRIDDPLPASPSSGRAGPPALALRAPDILGSQNTPEIQKLIAEREQLLAEMDAPSEGADPISSLIAAAIPLAVGAALGGKSGWGYGAKGAADALKEIRERQDKQEREANERRLKRLAIINDDVKLMRDLSRAQVEADAEVQNSVYKLQWDLEKQLLLEDIRFGNKQNLEAYKRALDRHTPGHPDAPADPAVVEQLRKLSEKAGIIFPGGEITNRYIGQLQQSIRLQQDINREARLGQQHDERISRQSYVALLQDIHADPKKQQTFGDGARKELNDIAGKLPIVIAAAQRLKQIAEETNNFIVNKDDYLGDALSYHSTLISVIKDLRNYGANFTEFEQFLTKGEIGVILEGASVTDYLTGRARRAQEIDYVARLDTFIGKMLKEGYDKLISRGKTLDVDFIQENDLAIYRTFMSHPVGRQRIAHARALLRRKAEKNEDGVPTPPSKGRKPGELSAEEKRQIIERFFSRGE